MRTLKHAALALVILSLVLLLVPRVAAQPWPPYVPTPPSGMLLGVYAFPTWQGLRVTSTIPGYSAHGRLFRGDILVRVTSDGYRIYPTRTLRQIEYAKEQIGPYVPAALEVYRPFGGYTYMWVTFKPVGGGPAAAMKAEIQTEAERPGAKALFDNAPPETIREPGDLFPR